MTAFRRVLALFRLDRMDRELDAEIAAHLELAERDALARGLSPAEARREARQAFGGVDGIREAHRDARSTRALEALWRDVRLGLRAIRRTPVVCAIVVIVLAVAVGANVTMFSALHGILLRPLAYGAADDLVIVMHHGNAPVSTANFLDWRRETRSFEAMGAAEYWRLNLGDDQGAERLLGLHVTEQTLPLLRVEPLLGRLPAADAFNGGDHHQVVIAHGLWVRRFGAAPNIIGQSLRLDGEPYTVVAVMPPGFVFAPFWAVKAELWAPMPMAGRSTARTDNSLRIFARLAPGVSIGQAQAEVSALTSRLEAEFPGTNRNVQVVSLKERVVGKTRLPVIVFMVGAGLVLAVACANVGHILLARASSRRREVAVRLALGATRLQIVRQFLVESLLLSVAAALVGLGLAVGGVRALVAYAPADLPRVAELGVNGVVLLFTLAVAIVTGVCFGLAPALQAARPVPGEHLAAGRGASADRRQLSTRAVLMASEVALSLVLVAVAGLMVRSLVSLQAVDPGFDGRGVLTFTVSVEGTAQTAAPRRAGFFTELTERFAALPGVESASAINHLPLGGDVWTRGVAIEGRPVAAPGEGIGAVYRVSLPGYFQTMGLPVVSGRDFTWRDVEAAVPVAIVSRDFAQEHWPGEDAMGKRILVGGSPSDPDARWRTIVGIVADAARDTWEGDHGDEVYLPYLQTTDYLTREAPSHSYMSFVLRARDGRAADLTADVRRTIADIDRGVALADIIPMEEAMSRSLARPRFQLTLLAACAVLALLLAAAGIYGVVSYAVARRQREIGLRMALGAQAPQVRRMIVGQSLKHVVIGVAMGWVGAFALARVMVGLLHGVEPGDPLTLVTATVVLIGVALFASSVPAWRASRVAPVVALKED
ncbi:MAG TPA: ABC transporter permease [Luteitalea sp.]|nr:ABC transporter permease [Luteitalea sp.]